MCSVYEWKCRNGEWEVRDMIRGAHSADYNRFLRGGNVEETQS